MNARFTSDQNLVRLLKLGQATLHEEYFYLTPHNLCQQDLNWYIFTFYSRDQIIFENLQ
jgi:hypothetical protein